MVSSWQQSSTFNRHRTFTAIPNVLDRIIFLSRVQQPKLGSVYGFRVYNSIWMSKFETQKSDKVHSDRKSFYEVNETGEVWKLLEKMWKLRKVRAECRCYLLQTERNWNIVFLSQMQFAQLYHVFACTYWIVTILKRCHFLFYYIAVVHL